jgi:sec-independent protein translocase protein TatA
MNAIASIMNLAGPDLIIILLIILVLFGAKKLPELARGMGQAVKEFQKAKDEFGDELHKAGTSDVNKQAADVKAAPLTLPRNTDSSPTTAAARPTPDEAVPPANESGQV